MSRWLLRGPGPGDHRPEHAVPDRTSLRNCAASSAGWAGGKTIAHDRCWRPRPADGSSCAGRRPQDTPVWAIFGDLMAGVVGVFVLMLVWILGYQVELAQSLEGGSAQTPGGGAAPDGAGRGAGRPAGHRPGHAARRSYRHQRQRAVFPNSDQLQPEGRELLRTLVAPLRVYLGSGRNC